MIELTYFTGIAEPLIISLSFLIKAYLIKLLIASGFHNLTIKRPLLFLIGTLLGSIIGDFAWIIKLLREQQVINISYASLVFIMRISWAFLALQYQSLSLFLESLVVKRFTLKMRHNFACAVSACFAGYFIILAITQGGLIDPIERAQGFSRLAWSSDSPTELKGMCFLICYLLFIPMLSSIIITVYKNRTCYLPVIVKHQISLLLKYLISAYLFVEILQIISFTDSFSSFYLYPTVTFSTLLLAYTMYYSVKKVMGMRFLNVHTHVQSSSGGNLIHTFKHIVEQLSHVTTVSEVCRITQAFFKDAFDIPLHKSHLHTRIRPEQSPLLDARTHNIIDTVETFLTTQKKSIQEYIYENKIIMYDELEFTNFYHDTPDHRTILAFMHHLDADIFIPIYEKKDIIAYIVIDRRSRKTELYGSLERDEMIILANYLYNIIYLLQHHNVASILLREKELKDEHYHMQLEADHFKESIRSYTVRQQHTIGIIFYKNRRFFYANQAAKELIEINLNTQSGHPLTKACRTLVEQVQAYKTAQSVMTADENNDAIMLCAEPHIEHSTIIVLVHKPGIHDLINKEIALLQDPTDWDYLLYLQTTRTGQLIHQLIPGTGETLLNFKINLMKIALNRKATLLQLPEEDLMPVVELLHHVREGETLHILNLTQCVTDRSKAVELFGMHQIQDHLQGTLPIFKRLHERGTLFIKNIHFLDLETQEYLAEYIKSGHYRAVNSEQRTATNMHLICSTQENLFSAVQNGTFSATLFHLLNKMTLSMSSLDTLPKEELESLADGLIEQAIRTADFKNMLELNEKEMMKLDYNRPKSLQHLRVEIEKLLVHKSKKNHIFQETHFDPAFHISDPELAEAARLGKHALRHQRIMTLLWDKFQSQNKIAAFLGVNRSSVNRRCKQFKLE